MTEILSFAPGFSFRTEQRLWRSSDETCCRVLCKDGREVPFSDAKCSVSPYVSGVGKGFKAVYSDFPGIDGLKLECRIWSENSSGDVIFELVPLQDAPVQEIYWPEAFENRSDKAFTVLPLMQGALIPNHTDLTFPDIWPVTSWYLEYRYSCSRSMYMQFYGQYDPDGACATILETRYDGGMSIRSGNGADVLVAPRWRESLGKVGYTRRLRVKTMAPGADYNDLAKAYRGYIRSIGELVTLKEKAAANPKVDELIGRPVVHTHIWYHNVPGSRSYDPDHPEVNDRKQSYAFVEENLRSLKARGIDKAVLHLDGWGRRGYDNQHPDYLPPAEEMGGWKAMKGLCDACHELGYFFGTHDQYRDYYYDAETFDESFACHNEDGSVFSHAVWAGGKMTLLCATQAPYYVHRNFDALKEHGIDLDNTYLDVFSCVELDECFSPEHPMTREQCAEGRMRCFRDVAARGILVQSEEGIDWAFPGLVFVHHAPFAPASEDRPNDPVGIQIPLLELVYHDCLITPYAPGRANSPFDPPTGNSLFGLLCGGAAYVPLDATDEEIRQCNERTAWQRDVQYRELVRHELIDGDPLRQRAEYEGGYSAEIDLAAGTYKLCRPE